MRKEKSFKILMGLFIIFLATPFINMSNKKIGVKDSLSANFPTLSDSTEIELPENFEYVYKRFKVYNPNIDTTTVITFNEVCSYYKLDTTDEMLDLCIGQILLESGAKQYYNSGPKDGQLVLSAGGAVGIAQIMPNTAYANLINYVSIEDADSMYTLGATSIDFIKKDVGKSSLVKLSREWLKNETNNLILWGFIMRRKIDSDKNILRVLVSYNAGTGGMLNYVNNGGSLNSHHYIKGIRNKLANAKAKI